MSQCLQIQSNGSRCPHPAEAGYSFCRWHIEEMLEAEDPGRRWRRFVLRMAALILLLIFLLPLALQGYRLLQAMLN
jgi:predicted nucleic acid-binding Zn ribbon protein